MRRIPSRSCRERRPRAGTGAAARGGILLDLTAPRGSGRLLLLVRDRPWQVVVGYTTLLGLLYALASRSPLSTPRVIFPGPWDRWIPMLPAAVIPSLTYLLLLPALILLTRRRPEFPRVLAAALGCGAVNVVVYLALPTRLARPDAPPVAGVLAILRRLDTPLCALPSGHVAMPAAIAVAAMLAARGSVAAGSWLRTAAGYLAWTLVLGAAALLTGQHYVVDVLAGVALGTVVAGLGMLVAAPARRGPPGGGGG